MSRTAVALMAVVWACGCGLGQQAANPITNGGFEKLGPDGWAVDWQRVGTEVSITHEARTGRNAVLLRRTREAISRKVETGLNRAWAPHTGQRGAMLAQRKGGVTFWYKVPAAPEGAHLRFYMIPMSGDPLENTGSPREWYEVPSEHFGDGKWHQGMVAYDFTDNKKCRWVQVSPRVISDEPAEWIIDDIKWVPSIGAVANVTAFDLAEVRGKEGKECTIRAVIKNAGDKILRGKAELRVPAGLRVAEPGPAQTLGPLRPGDIATLRWRVAGVRSRQAVVHIRVSGGVIPASASLKLSPDLRNVWLETQQFVLWPGKETTVSLVVENEGTAAARNIRASLRLPPELEAVGETQATLALALPGRESRLAFKVRARKQTPGAVIECQWTAGDKSGEATSRVVIGAPAPKPGSAPADAARIGCGAFEIIFPRNEFGYGIGWIFTRPDGELVAVMPYLARAVIKARDEKTVYLYADAYQRTAAVKPLGLTDADLQRYTPRGLLFTVKNPDLQRLGLPGPVAVAFVAVGAEGAGGTVSRMITYQVSCPAPASPLLLALEGPKIYVGEGSFGGEKDEALYPGLEWLVSGEKSSSTLDIAADHPHRVRYVAHPHMVTIPLMAVRRGKVCVGLLWHARSKWNDGRNRQGLAPDRSDVDRPSAIFASPDRFEGHASHAMGLFVPTVPEYVQPNETVAEKPWPAQGVGAKAIKLVSAIYVNPRSDTAMDAMRAWFDIYGVAPPRKLPHTSGWPREVSWPAHGFRGYDLPPWAEAADRKGRWLWGEPTREQWIDEIEWSMQAYLTTLWDEEAKGWHSFKGGPAQTKRLGPHSPFLYDLVVAARLTDDIALRRRLQQRINLVKRIHPHVIPRADDMEFNFGQPLGALFGLAGQAQGLMRSQDQDGGWRFHPYIAKSGVFKGRDYAELGYEGQEAVGLVARKAWTLLRLARMTGDRAALTAGLNALHYMDKFIVPRAAQVWEVPVHTPDILASSDACEAFLEAYYITGDKRWLKRAVYWEETGLPFLYQWDVDPFPWMRYASIPVFGATWFRGSWFGRAVQWNGLRWAFAALKLAEVDDTYPWRMLAAGVTISAIYQQAEDQEDLAMWPDSISAIDARKSGWIFAPRAILKNVYKLLGYEPEPVTARVQSQGGSILINACGKIENARLNKGVLRFTLSAPAPLPTRVLVCAVSEPKSVKMGGQELPKRDDLAPGETVGWRYYPSYSVIEISPGKPGKFNIELSPVKYQRCKLMAPEAREIAWEFDKDDGGWRPAHDLTSFVIERGMLVTRATGRDPYMVRSNCRIEGNSVARVHVRMAVSAGAGAELYWTTVDSPQYAEDKTVKIQIRGDGKPHDYYFDVGRHPMWRGKTITGLRLDPMSGADAADIRIDFIRGEK